MQICKIMMAGKKGTLEYGIVCPQFLSCIGAESIVTKNIDCHQVCFNWNCSNSCLRGQNQSTGLKRKLFKDGRKSESNKRCWFLLAVTGSISSWQKYYKSVIPKDEWWVAELLFLSLNNGGLNVLQNGCSQSSQIYLSPEKLRKMFTFQSCK